MKFHKFSLRGKNFGLKSPPLRKKLELPTFNMSDNELLEWNRQWVSWIDLYYGNVSLLCNLIGAKSILEIGVAHGYHANFILEQNKEIHYTGIDPYNYDYETSGEFISDMCNLFSSDPMITFERLYQAVVKNLQNYSNRATLIRLKSSEALSQIRNDSYDLIFLDGDHSYDAVSFELKNYYKKVRSGGIVSGDDYNWPEVKKAVDDFIKESGEKLFFISKGNSPHKTYFFLKS